MRRTCLSQPADRTHSPRIRRTGAALIIAIVALLICTSICVSLARTSLLRQARLQQRQWRLQAELLADAGLTHLQKKLSASVDHPTETWNPRLGQGEYELGQIRYLIDSENEERFNVTVIANYPQNATGRAQVTLKTTIDKRSENSRAAAR